MVHAIELENVRKTFGSVRAVDGLSIRVPPGSVYGFLGPNGAGKTTTLRMVMDIIRPDSGTLRLFGRPASCIPRSRVGYMPEERGLYRKMTVSDVLAYFGSLKGIVGAELRTRVAQWLERIALAEYANKKVEELSRGMHQKLQFAVTVINEPELVILDEPFSGLDPVNQDLLRQIIIEMRRAGRTVVFSTHVMHEAERLCDFLLLINRGRVVVDGTLDEIRRGHESHTVSVGSICNTLKETQSLLMPIMLVFVVPIMAGVKLVQNPNGDLARVLSFVPPTTPMVMILRLSSGSEIWTGEIILSIITLAAGVLATLWAAAKVFRTGILMYGKRPGPREIARWLGER